MAVVSSASPNHKTKSLARGGPVLMARTASRTVATPRPPSLAFIEVGSESKWLIIKTAPVLSVPGMRAMTFRIRPAKTWPKSARALTASTTSDSTPSTARRVWIFSMAAACSAVPIDLGIDATARRSTMARSAENTSAGALAGTTLGVHLNGEYATTPTPTMATIMAAAASRGLHREILNQRRTNSRRAAPDARSSGTRRGLRRKGSTLRLWASSVTVMSFPALRRWRARRRGTR